MTVLLATLRAFVLATACASVDCAHYGVGPKPGSVQMTFASSSDTRGFAWHTDLSVEESEVRILKGAYGEKDSTRFAQESVRFTGDNVRRDDEGLIRHRVRVTGLSVPTNYSYRLGGGGQYVYGSFAVRPTTGRKMTILNLNDAQTKDAKKLWMWENTVAGAARTAGGADAVDFILSGGDFCDGRFSVKSVGKYLQWGVAADAATPHVPGVPWVMASGNHDAKLYSDCTAVDYAKGLPAGCHTLDYGSVHVATIPFVSGKWNDKWEKVMDWLARDLAAVRAAGRSRWTVVSTHWGPYTTGDHGMLDATSILVRRFAPICASNHVDLVVQAHDHTYSKTRPYRWDAAGWTRADDDAVAVNLMPKQADGWDVDPHGTYYVSCGCAGHRVGENAKYASATGKKSYRARKYKIVTGRLAVDSPYGKKGDDASDDLGFPMFGVLRIDGSCLEYDFYVSTPDGTSVLYDRLKVRKTDSSAGI